MWRKYFKVGSLSWTNGFVYRANFITWRLRMVIQFLAVYFLWEVVISKESSVFGYEKASLFTYILAASLLRSIVLSSKSIDAQTEIATGELSNYLLKPINYFGLWFSRDMADKILNSLFCVVEIGLIYALLKPPILLQTNGLFLGLSLAAAMLSILMYFCFSFIISMTTFWYSEANGWPQRFLILTLLEFFIGALFPLNILPERIFNLIQFFPTTYFIYFPIQLYLGSLSNHQIVWGFSIMVLWIALFIIVTKKLWLSGVRSYEAYGR